MMKKFFLALLLCLLPAASHGNSCVVDDMVGFINEVNYKINDIIKHQDLKGRKKAVGLIVEQNLDIEFISKFLMGQYFKSASKAQRANFQTQVSKYLGRKYAGYLANGIDGDILVLRAKCYDQTQGFVMIRVTNCDNSFYTMQYKMVADNKAGYRIGDVTVNGTSLLIAIHDDFDKAIAATSLDKHIATMTQDNLNSDI